MKHFCEVAAIGVAIGLALGIAGCAVFVMGVHPDVNAPF